LRDFWTTRGLAISWLIVGISPSPFYQCKTEKPAFANSFGTTGPIGSHHARKTRAKRNRANCSLLSGKRFDATEDRSRNRSA
jgi:hypothetical protein